tara:strand:+ start:5394 stop:5996 length:603 start_codon:yes stop_codon:yes gene_type:complete
MTSTRDVTRDVTRMVISCFLLFACVYVLFIENHLLNATLLFASTPTCDILDVGVSYNYYGIPTNWNGDTLIAITGGFVFIQFLSHFFIEDSFIRLIPSTGVLIGVVTSSYGEIYRLISAFPNNEVRQETVSQCGIFRGKVVVMTYSVYWMMVYVLIASVVTVAVLFTIQVVSAILRLRSETRNQVEPCDQVKNEPIMSMV